MKTLALAVPKKYNFFTVGIVTTLLSLLFLRRRNRGGEGISKLSSSVWGADGTVGHKLCKNYR